MPLRRIFAATSVVFLVILAISPVKNVLRPYRATQRRYFNFAASRAKSLKEARQYSGRSVAIQQFWLHDFNDRVDRCTTCHLGAADPVMAGAPEPYPFHSRTAHTPVDFDRFGCTSCHGGQGLATDREDAHGTARDAGPPMLPPSFLEAGCGRCHFSSTVPEAPTLSRGREVMARKGCYACHSVPGHGDFVSEAPPLASVSMKTGGIWLRQWLKNPRAVDPNATMPNFHLGADSIETLSNYLFSLPVPDDLARQIRAAAQEPAGDPATGKKLFAESRCITCHTVEGKGNGTAPELSRVASAASAGWLLAFLRNPQAFNPRTRMPRFNFSEAESRDVVAYLEQDFRDFDAPANILDPIHVNQTLAEKGEKVFRSSGCLSCHDASSAGRGEKFGPDLAGIADKKASSLDFGRRTDIPRTLPAWLAAKIDAPHSFAQGLKMPSYDLNAEDANAVVTALLSLGAEPPPERYRVESHAVPSLLPGGPIGKLIDSYRCLSCHRIGDRGEDLSTAPLTFEGSKVKREWLIDYLSAPYTLRPILEERMPALRITREQATLLADAIQNFYVDPEIAEDPFAGRPPGDSDTAEGSRLYVTLGCRGCHILGASGGYVGPPLSDTPKRLRPGWVYFWLKGPQRWREDVRCPNYGMSKTDALRITAYLESLPPSIGQQASK